jgi:vancomycin resistance protein YoaR
VTPVPPNQADEAPTVAFRATAAVPQPAQPSGDPVATDGPSAAPAPAGDGAGARRKAMIIAAGVAALGLVAGVGTYAYAAVGDIPRGTRVLGVDLGGKSTAEATTALQEQLRARTSAPARVTLNGKSLELPAKDVGLVLDIPATVGAAADSGLRLFGTEDVSPVTRIDAKKLEAALRKQLDPKSVTVKNPAITYAGLVPTPTYPAPGRDLSPAPTAELVRGAWLAGTTVDIPLVERPPATTAAQVDELIASLAKPAVAAPVTVTTPRGTFTLTPKAIAKGLVFTTNADGVLSPKIDAKRLRAAAADELAKVEVAPEEASISLKGGKPRVVASTSGQAVDLAKLGPALLGVLPNTDGRTVEAGIVEQPAKTTDADMVKLGIKEKVSTFTTKFTGGLRSPRSQNIVTIAKEVDGAVVKPGETFSLNGHTGVRSYPQGYKDAPVIIGGKLEPGVGGGASQFTTTLFNAAYYAGLQDVEHKPHSFYFSRYPAVIEATIFYPTLDLKFKNTTPYGILIDTSHTSRTVTVSLWSTKVYDSVKTERSPRRNITSPQTVYRDPGPKCIATSGLPGFTQDAYRVIRKDGKEVKREKFTWRYDPEPRFICAKEPS